MWTIVRLSVCRPPVGLALVAVVHARRASCRSITAISSQYAAKASVTLASAGHSPLLLVGEQAGTSSPSRTRRNHHRSTSVMWRMRPSNVSVLGGQRPTGLLVAEALHLPRQHGAVIGQVTEEDGTFVFTERFARAAA